MPLILRLCLHAVDARSDSRQRTQLWLSFSIVHSTSTRDIIQLARRSVEERMAAELEVRASHQTQLALCVRNVHGQYVFLGTAAMTEASAPIMKMPFLMELLRVEQEKLRSSASASEEATAAWKEFIFVRGALVPLADLRRLNRRLGNGDDAQFAMYETVEITPELGSDPVVADPPPLWTPDQSSINIPVPAAPNSNSKKNNKNDISNSGAATPIRVRYVDFAGRHYTAVVQPPDAHSLSAVLYAACTTIGAQVGCAFQPSNMTLMCSFGNTGFHAVDNDTTLTEALKDDDARLYLAADTRLLSSPSPQRSEASSQPAKTPLREGEPVLLLQESRDEYIVEAAATSSSSSSLSAAAAAAASERSIPPWGLATSAVTIRRVGTVSPTPSFTPRDRQSVLRTRPVVGVTAAVATGMRDEEDNARLRLAAAHLQMDEAQRRYMTVMRESSCNAACTELLKKKTVLSEELTECISAERDCERLEMLVAWLEKDIADGHARQEKLIRALYAT
ncbi:hypothetical protein DQ04_05071050 [Trypanosoma grayi]|uniref:hypothetical protein n=1 Tax=Trypanosoma grayi TaxID=71804 RepID=UPI0004F4999F|nr:hypothetical protein DQ04_05071050 [Trypanosoma grayi]KEG09534.1 hypothetical protein DQ04_05071050 [Trypanosoma grayi]